jgi:hypothetical protein
MLWLLLSFSQLLKPENRSWLQEYSTVSPLFYALNPFLTQSDIYIGMELSVVPVFQSEIAPTQVRGFMVGTYQLTIAVSVNRPQNDSLIAY